MAWFKVDDGFYTSHKVLQIPRKHRNAAIGAWILLGTWSADKMTDGEVPTFVVDDFDVSDEALHWLLEVGLWIRTEAGIRFHDWCEYQPTKAQLEAKSKSRAEVGSIGGKKSGEARRSKAEAKLKQNEANANPEPEPEPIKNTSSPMVTDFDSFWSLWPRKEGKANALKAYEKSLKKIPEPELLDKARLYVTSPLRPDVKFVPHAATWLNGERWADDLVPVARVADPNDWMKSEPIVLP